MSFATKRNRVSIVPAHRDPSSERSSEDRNENVIRPSTLQKIAPGASSRLTALSTLIQNYSSVVGVTRLSAEMNTSPIMEDINKIQRMLKSNLQRSVSTTLQANWEVQPRKTLFTVQDSTDQKSGLGPSLDWSKSEMNRMFNFIRDLSLKKLQADTIKKLQIVYNVHKSLITETPEHETKFSPFGWSLEDFITRRNENGTVWVDSLLSLSEKDLEMVKFKYDMEELFKIIHMLFTATVQSLDGESDDIFRFVEEVYDFLQFPFILKAEAKRNMEKLHDQVNTYLDMLNFKRGAEEEAYKKSLEERLMDISVLGPIELRYEVNWMETKVDQNILKMTNEIKEIENQITDCNRQQSKELYCSRCVLDMYYYDIENFKRRIAEISNRFEQELEQIENEISYKTLSLDKMLEQRRFLEEQIILFDEEVQQILQKEIDDKIAEEERKREEEMRALEAAMEKAKKKGKGKDKNKKK